MFQNRAFTWLLLSSFICAKAVSLNFKPSAVALMQAQKKPTYQRLKEYSHTATYFDDLQAFEGATEKRFVLKNLLLKGASKIEELELADFYEHLISHEISTKQLVAVAQDIEKRYREAGYMLSHAYVPFQDVSHGEAEIKIHEGRIRSIKYRWVHLDKNQSLQKRIDQLQNVIFNQNTLNEILADLNAMPGIQASFSLEASATHEGDADLVVVVARQRFEVKAGVSDTNPESTGRWVAGLDLTLNSPFNMGEKITLRGAMYPSSPYGRFTQYGSDVLFPILEGRYYLKGGFDNLKTAFDYSDQDGKLQNRNYSRYNLGLLFNFFQTTDLKFSAEVDYRDRRLYKNQKSALVKTQAVQAKVNIDFLDILEASNYFSFSMHKGLDMWSSQTGDARKPKDFTHLNWHYYRHQPLSEQITFKGLIRAQYSHDYLPEVEKFYFGGMPYGLAFPIGAMSGDSGVHAKLEVSYSQPVNVLLQQIELYGYFEQGTLWNWKGGLRENKKTTLKGYGLGARMLFESGFNMFLEYGFPLGEVLDRRQVKKKLYAGFGYSNTQRNSTKKD